MNQVLVLNFDYSPLNITSIKRGFKLVYKGKAEIIKSDKNSIYSSVKEYLRPVIIRLLKYIQFHSKIYKISRIKIYKRDNHQCVYCGSRKNLTLDHVIPKSKGGLNSWENLVTSCFKCNLKKGNRTPEEAQMKMSHEPFIPSLIYDNHILQGVWNDFQNSFFL